MLLWLLKFLKLSQFSVHYFVSIHFVTFFSGLYVWLSCRFSWNGWPPAHTYDVHAESEEAGWWVIVKIHETLREMTFVEQLTWFIKQRINLFDYFSPLTEQIFRTKRGACMWYHMERALTRKEGKNQGRHDQEGRNYWIAYRKMSGRNMSKRRSWKEL